MRTALVVAAHPDDEILGCGGAISRMTSEGWTVHHLILAEGATSRSRTRSRDGFANELGMLERAAREAGRIVGAASVELADFPDNRMDRVDLLDVVKRIEESILAFKPVRVFTHHCSDVNVDHSVVHRAVAAATRPLPGTTVKQLLFFEVPSSTEWRPSGSGTPFVPNLFIDISSQLPTKIAALEAYETEMRPPPHPRSLASVSQLAAWRGAMVGVDAAEAFHIGRWIE